MKYIWKYKYLCLEKNKKDTALAGMFCYLAGNFTANILRLKFHVSNVAETCCVQ